MACDRPHPRGWKCVTYPHLPGPGYTAANVPCGLVPRWWNLTKFARRYKKGVC